MNRSRFPLAVALVPMAFVVNLLVGACDAGGLLIAVTAAQAGPGGMGGAGGSGDCECRVKEPTVVEVQCVSMKEYESHALFTDESIAVDRLAQIQVIGRLIAPTQINGSAFGWERAAVVIDDGRMIVDCINYGAVPKPKYSSVKFLIP